MKLTSRDIARQDFPKRLLGWSPQDVRAFLLELARALDDLRAMNEALTRRAAELEAAARTASAAPAPQAPAVQARTAEISRAEAQGIIREAETQAQQITGAARAEFVRLGEQITILESKQESVARKLRQFLNAELEIVRTIEESGARAAGAPEAGPAPSTTSDIEEILRSLETR